MTRRASRARPARRSAFSLHGDAALAPATARRLRRLTWAVAGLLGLALLATVLGPHRVGDYFTETDFYGGYAEGARGWLRGHVDPSRYGVVGPGYEIALAAVAVIVRDLFFAAELISVIATVGVVLLWARLLERRGDARFALGAAAFLAVNPTLFRYGYSATTDAFALALQALALFLLLARPRLSDAMLAGLVAAAAFLTRYSAVYLVPAGLVALLAGGTPQERRGRAAIAFAAGFLAPVVPWVLFSIAHGGALTLQLHHNIAYDVFARAKGIPWDDYQKLMQPQFPTLASVIARDPGAVFRRELFNVWDHLRLDATSLLGVPVAITAGVGLLLAAQDRTLRRLWPLWVTGALAFAVLVPVFYSERYSLPLLPIYLTLAAAAFASPRFALAIHAGRPTWLKPALALVPLALSLQASVRVQSRVLDQLPVEVLEAGRTLRQLARPGDRVIARKAHIAFHGGVAALPFPFTRTLPELAAYARDKGARWLFFSWPEAEMRPAYFYLLDTSGVVPGLMPRRVTFPHPSVLYEIGPAFGTEPAWLANDTLKALHTARARIMVDGRDVRALNTLAYVARARGRITEAQDWAERAARVAPNDLGTILLLGDVYLLLGDPSRAASHYAHALAVQPGNVAAQVGLGWAALVADQPQEAARLWRPVIGQTRDGATLRRMADLYRSLRDDAAEAAVYERLAALRTGDGR